MNLLETTRAAETAEAQARKMAAAIQAVAAGPRASEIAQLAAEAAGSHVSIAEINAGTIPREEAEAQMRSLMASTDDLYASTIARVEERAAADGLTSEGEIYRMAEEEIQPSLASLDRLQEQMQLWLLEHRLDAWRRAETALREILPPELQPH